MGPDPARPSAARAVPHLTDRQTEAEGPGGHAHPCSSASERSPSRSQISSPGSPWPRSAQSARLGGGSRTPARGGRAACARKPTITASSGAGARLFPVRAGAVERSARHDWFRPLGWGPAGMAGTPLGGQSRACDTGPGLRWAGVGHGRQRGSSGMNSNRT